MCNPDENTRDWRLYVADMASFSERALSFTEGMDQDGFAADLRTYDAVLRNIELIGEAARQIPEQVQELHPQIPWRRIIGTRNRVAHGYLGIDDDIIWDIVQNEIPDLLPKLRSLLHSTSQENP